MKYRKILYDIIKKLVKDKSFDINTHPIQIGVSGRLRTIQVCRSLKEFYDPMIHGATGVQPPTVETAFDIYMCHYLSYDHYNFIEMCRSIGAAHGTENYYVKEAEKIMEELSRVLRCPLEDLSRIDCGPIAKNIAINRLKKSHE